MLSGLRFQTFAGLHHLPAGPEHERTIPEYPFRKLDRNFGLYAPAARFIVYLR
jgi:hypothetical protein